MAVENENGWGGRKKFARIQFFHVSKKQSSPKIIANFYKNDDIVVGSIWIQLEGRQKGFRDRIISNLYEFISSGRGAICMPNCTVWDFFVWNLSQDRLGDKTTLSRVNLPE